jgi:hypothetical protein
VEIPPLNSIPDTRRLLGNVGTTLIYVLASVGQLELVKVGSLTKVTGPSIRRYIESLPKADVCIGRLSVGATSDTTNGMEASAPSASSKVQRMTEASLQSRRLRSTRTPSPKPHDGIAAATLGECSTAARDVSGDASTTARSGRRRRTTGSSHRERNDVTAGPENRT